MANPKFGFLPALCPLRLCGKTSGKRDGTVFFPPLPAKIPSKNINLFQPKTLNHQLIMPSEAQIAANRLNAQKSTGISPLNTSLHSRRFAIRGLTGHFSPEQTRFQTAFNQY
jgi:hypothetical protein